MARLSRLLSSIPLALRLTLLAFSMLGFGYLMVPLYDVLCDLTGLNGATSVATVSSAEAMQVDHSRLITIEFTGSLNRGAAWEFSPDVDQMQVHPGETYMATYYARNLRSSQTVAQAVPSVAPSVAGLYFKKIECFCFTEQVFSPGEEKHMPVQFVVSPELPVNVDTITLSYTLFNKQDVQEHVHKHSAHS